MGSRESEGREVVGAPQFARLFFRVRNTLWLQWIWKNHKETSWG
jgi:hypothetical protein